MTTTLVEAIPVAHTIISSAAIESTWLNVTDVGDDVGISVVRTITSKIPYHENGEVLTFQNPAVDGDDSAGVTFGQSMQSGMIST